MITIELSDEEYKLVISSLKTNKGKASEMAFWMTKDNVFYKHLTEEEINKKRQEVKNLENNLNKLLTKLGVEE